MITQDMVTAEIMQFGSQLALSQSVVDSAKLYERNDIGLKQLIYSVTIGLLGKETHTEEYEDIVKTYPATMWEELKSLWPRWLRRRFPVRYTRDICHRTVKDYHICPHMDYPHGDLAHVRWLRNETD